jgi:hypothetical protein
MKTFYIAIQGVGTKAFYCHTHWQAIDQAHTAFQADQPDRKLYKPLNK